MTAPKIALRKIADLTPDPRNARIHSSGQIDQIVASIRRFGWTNPVLADDMIRAGHGRVMAATVIYDEDEAIYLAPGRDRGGKAIPKGTVPVIDCSGWTEDERKAYNLADNQIAANAEWDIDLLNAQITELQSVSFNIIDIGFDPEALAALGLNTGSEPQVDPEEVPEAPEHPVSVLGDIWVLGNHRIICGSSTDPEAVAALLGDAKPHLMVTDPPYGVEYDASFRNGIRRADGSIVSARAIGKVMNDDQADWREAWALFPGDVAYVWHAGVHATEVDNSLQACGFEIRSQIIWAKQQFAIGRGNYHWQHEPCWYAVRKGKKGCWAGDRKQTTLWHIDKPHKSETGHSTQKPIECMRKPMENNSKPGDVVYEPFSGSGTSIIAGELIGRVVYAVELNPAYVDVAVRRWEEVTGKSAVHDLSGLTFAETATARTSEELQPLSD